VKDVCMKSFDEKQTIVVKRPTNARGLAEHGWLYSRHTFSFGEYFDPDQMGFRSLRVINEDIVEAGKGFGAHAHRDAEIFSYVIEGELQHKDSLGNGSIIKAGDLQYISAGDGLTHSEFNPSKTKRVHFYQIWLTPNVSGGKPRYAEKTLGISAEPNTLTLLFAPTERDGAVAIRQDAEIYFGKLGRDRSLEVKLESGRHVWLQVIRGGIRAVGETLIAGDGLAISNADSISIDSEEDSEFLVFNLA
jgi:quercetin 2,3-dioxygenase